MLMRKMTKKTPRIECFVGEINKVELQSMTRYQDSENGLVRVDLLGPL